MIISAVQKKHSATKGKNIGSTWADGTTQSNHTGAVPTPRTASVMKESTAFALKTTEPVEPDQLRTKTFGCPQIIGFLDKMDLPQ